MRRDLIAVAQETMRITRDGAYSMNWKTIELPEQPYFDFQDVKALSPETLRAIAEDEDEFFERAFWGVEKTNFYVVSADSFSAAEVTGGLVMNFANAHHSGGGFLHGAVAQEEALCRCSTLFASISNDEAKKMYEYNHALGSPVDSDYMLLSPSVAVFRDKHLELMEEPFNVAVMTIAAPNRHGRAAIVSEGRLREVLRNRLELFFWAAAHEGYRTLVLGAWGCGAFGNDAAEVASIMRELLTDQFEGFFENVVFAVPGHDYNYQCFEDAFRDCAEIVGLGELQETFE